MYLLEKEQVTSLMENTVLTRPCESVWRRALDRNSDQSLWNKLEVIRTGAASAHTHKAISANQDRDCPNHQKKIFVCAASCYITDVT
jgi:hypothetical protein